MTNILSNGSKWIGEEPDTIEKLLDVLRTKTLDPIFEKYGNFINKSPKWGWYGDGPSPYPDNPNVVVFFGDFYDYGHLFSIHTDEPLIITILEKAILDNQQTEAYQKAKQEVTK